jgi:serine/threonine-protein kinase RsbW
MEIRLARNVAHVEPLLAAVRGFCTQQAVPETASFALQIAAEELFTNLVKYSNSEADSIAVSLERRGAEILLHLSDQDAAAFDGARAPAPDVDAALQQRQAGGLGLHLVKHYMDDLVYTHDGRTLRITASKTLEA